jgi:membrane-associated phospholipid phosphatase
MNSISKQILLSFFSFTILSIASVTSASASNSPGFGTVIVEDVKYEATAPSRWDTQDWKDIGWAALAVAGTSVVADRPVRDFMRKQAPGNTFLNDVQNFGQSYAVGVVGGFYVVGLMTDNEKTVHVGEDLISASLVSAAINQTIKVTVNRFRPRDDQGIVNIQGYSGLNNNSSFPSGHTTEAFTLASVIASSYEDDPWVAYSVYSVAGMVGIARMYLDAHWASDVVASAFIGTWVGKSVVSYNKSLRGNSKNKVSIIPDVAPGYTGIRVVSQF